MRLSSDKEHRVVATQPPGPQTRQTVLGESISTSHSDPSHHTLTPTFCHVLLRSGMIKAVGEGQFLMHVGEVSGRG